MFTSKLDEWLDSVDPYAIQRLAFFKAAFTATIMTFVYWLYLPADFMSFMLPVLIIGWYELPGNLSPKQKDITLILMFAVLIAGHISFYLLYPFRFVFLFYSIAFLALFYYFVVRYIPETKNRIMLILVSSTAGLTANQPPANLQIAYDFFTSDLLSMITLFACLKLYPNRYLEIWCRALQKFIQCLEKDIESAISQLPSGSIHQELNHILMMRSFQRWIPKKDLSATYRIFVQIGNIQLALDNIYEEDKNVSFWLSVQHHLATLRNTIKEKKEYPLNTFSLPEPENEVQKMVMKYLNEIVYRWNILCNKFKY